MYREHSIGVVIPVYNEEQFIKTVVTELPEFIDAVYLIDDASTDGTWQAIGEVMRDHADGGAGSLTPNLAIHQSESPLADRVDAAEAAGSMMRLRHAENRGAGGAVKTGYLMAHTDGLDVVATIDGDGQMDSSHLPRLLDPIVSGEAGYAKGNRFGGETVLGKMPPFRLFGNVLLTGLTRVASGYWRLSDPQNGFTAISHEALSAVDLDRLWEYYGYMNQLVAQLNTAGVRIVDVPMPSTYGDEESHIHYPEYITRVSLLLLVSFLHRLRTKYATDGIHAALICYVVGALLVTTGLLERVRLPGMGDDTVPRRITATKLAVGLAALLTGAVFDHTAPPFTTDAAGIRPNTKSSRLVVDDDE